MTDQHAIQPLPVEIAPLPGQQPVSVTYCDQGRSLAVVYTQPPEPQPAQPNTEPRIHYHPLIVAVTLLVTSVSLALTVATVGVMFEAVFPAEVQHHDR
ncbi:MAG: hypothetical protein AAF215_31505 [Cyanobacteria bacterium P01_A01_bin.123]